MKTWHHMNAEEKTARIRSLYDRGLRWRQMARVLHVSTHCVGEWMAHAGLDAKQPANEAVVLARLQDGWTVDQVAKRMRTTKTIAKKIAREHGLIPCKVAGDVQGFLKDLALRRDYVQDLAKKHRLSRTRAWQLKRKYFGPGRYQRVKPNLLADFVHIAFPHGLPEPSDEGLAYIESRLAAVNPGPPEIVHRAALQFQSALQNLRLQQMDTDSARIH